MESEQKISIDRASKEGEGIGYLSDGRIVFVEGALPGETVQIELTELKNSFGRGRVIEVVEPSEHRTEPDCAFYPECGGCQFWHTDYTHEFSVKANDALETIKRIAKISLPEVKKSPAKKERHYRTKMTLHREESNGDGSARWALGFYNTDSTGLVEIDECLIADKKLNRAKHLLEPALADLGDLKLSLETASSSEVVATIRPENWSSEHVPPSLKDRQSELDKSDFIRGLRVQHSGRDLVIGDPTVDVGQLLARPPGDKDMRARSGLFRQANASMNVELVDWIADSFAQIGARNVLELYCGAGNLSFGLASVVSSLYGLDASEGAVATARGLAEIDTSETDYAFTEMDVSEDVDEWLPRQLYKFDTLLLDPPRQGARKVCQQLGQMRAEVDIVYVSCDPACLGRDLKELVNGGWEVQQLKFLDMFPRTGHIETVAVLRK